MESVLVGYLRTDLYTFVHNGLLEQENGLPANEV